MANDRVSNEVPAIRERYTRCKRDLRRNRIPAKQSNSKRSQRKPRG